MWESTTNIHTCWRNLTASKKKSLLIVLHLRRNLRRNGEESMFYEKIKSNWLWIGYVHGEISIYARRNPFAIKRKSKNSSLLRKRNPLFKKKRNPFSWIQNYGCSSTRSSRESFPEVKASESSLLREKYLTRALFL